MGTTSQPSGATSADDRSRGKESPRPEPVFLGFADGQPDLQEFRTSDGHHVDLDDLECVAIDFRPLTRNLVITFEAQATPTLPREIAKFTFSDAQIYQWEDDPTADAFFSERGQRLHGQVSFFAYSGDGCFCLSLFDQGVAWVASAVRCEVTSD